MKKKFETDRYQFFETDTDILKKFFTDILANVQTIAFALKCSISKLLPGHSCICKRWLKYLFVLCISFICIVRK